MKDEERKEPWYVRLFDWLDHLVSDRVSGEKADRDKRRKEKEEKKS